MSNIPQVSMLCLLMMMFGCAKIENPIEPSQCQTGRGCAPNVSACNIVSSCPDYPVSLTNTIEIRVLGNATSARIRYSNAVDGLAQIVTTLPFITSVKTDRDNLFLSLEVTPISYSALTMFPFISAQIFVNGELFREATSTDFLLSTISVNGTFRR
jgi:hypothetical protein